VHRHPSFWINLGRFESRVLADQLRDRPVRAPVYICGLARSGSSLLHEVVASHTAVATHRSKDYPMVFTPYWWRRATAGMPASAPRERPHGDGVMVTTESPDSLEEMIWTAFFPNCHRPATSAVLGANDRHPEFEAFYDFNLRKLMLAEGADRYAAKNNYNVARLSYLVRLYPDARILIPVREPSAHVASLVRQQRLFSAGQRAHPRARAYMRRSGHFEFGLDRRPINLGNGECVRRIQEALAGGDEAGGLALYWDATYRYVWDVLQVDAAVARAIGIVRFEDVAAEPAATLRAALRHCGLADADAVAEEWVPRVRRPTSDPAVFSERELAAIRERTAATAALWGYA
ncbi:MAG TPA: sulfotransferase, partial [Gemmataceae bacterium]